MTNEDLLQKTLTATLERMAKQTLTYETEIANLNAQLLIVKEQVNEKTNNTKTRSNKTEEKDLDESKH